MLNASEQWGSLATANPTLNQSDNVIRFAVLSSGIQAGALSEGVLNASEQWGSLAATNPTLNQSDNVIRFAVLTSGIQAAVLSKGVLNQSDFRITFRSPVLNSGVQRADIWGIVPVLTQSTQRGNIGEPATLLVSVENYMDVRGRRVRVLDATGLTINSGNFAWSATVNLAFWSDFKMLRNGDDFDLVLQGDRYRLMVDDQGVNRTSSPKIDLSISCVSPTVRLDNTTYSQVNQTWQRKTPTEIIAELLPAEYTLVWETDNSVIREYVASSKSIMGVIRELAERIGAIVQTQKDGYTIKVYPFYRTKPERWATLELAETHRFERGNLSQQMRWGKIKKWNSVVIGDEEMQLDCAMEAVENNTKLRLYPVPFREMEVGTTRVKGAFIGILKYVEREEKICNLEFKDGKASVNYPIYELLECNWKENIDLGFPEYVVDGKELSVSTENEFSGHSLAGIRYTVRYWECAISVPADIQFLAIEKV